MSISRRKFVKAGALFGLTATVLPVNVFAQKGSPVPPAGGKPGVPANDYLALSFLTRKNFEDCLGKDFIVFLKTGGAQDLTLAEVNDLPFKGVGKLVPKEVGQGEGFSLIFTGSVDSPLRQDVYTMGSPRTGTFAMLLVPVGMVDRNSKVRKYEALINRLF